VWLGSLLSDKQDKALTFYRRNRVYDPLTRQFTQEDPIGLAGGLNLYGFANGDPVNFSDPFGLCPIPASDCPPGYFATRGLVIGAATGAIVLGGCAIITDGVCGLAASQIIGAFTGLGASLGLAADASNGTGRLLDMLQASKSGPPDDNDPTAGEIISRDKKGSINRVFPGEMRDKTRGEIDELARKGDKAARTARKLLTEKRFNK